MRQIFAAALVVLFTQSLEAATYTVTNTNDSGPGSLRDAVIQANTAPGADIIDFTVTGTIVLTTGQMNINGPLTINGPGAASLAISGNANSRIFSIFENVADVCATPGTDFPVSISGLKLVDGRRSADNPGGAMYSEKTLSLTGVEISDSQAKSGGGLTMLTRYTGQSLTINNSTFAANTARPFMSSTPAGVGTVGGGLFVSERCGALTTANVAIAISDSVFFGNMTRPATYASQGAGIAIFTRGTVQVARTRIVRNQIITQAVPVNNRGGGLSINSATSVTIDRSEITDNRSERGPGVRFITEDPNLQTPGTVMAVHIINSTIAGNVATTGSAAGIGVYGNVDINLDSSTVSNNIGAGGLAAIRIDTGPTTPVSAGNTRPGTLQMNSSIVAGNGTTPDIGMSEPSLTVFAPNSLIGSVQAGVVLTGAPLQGVDPLLGPPMFNGGPTRTMALVAGSPAINAGSNPLNLTTDQRGAGYPRVVGAAADMGAFETGTPLPPAGFAAGTVYVTSNINATPTGIAYLPVVCPASGQLVVSGSGESAATSSNDATAFIGMAYSIARDSATTDNSNVVQSSALAKFNGDANRDFLNVQRFDTCTPGQTYTYFLTAYATTFDTDTLLSSFVWNGRLTSSGGPAVSSLAAGTTYVTSATNATPTVVTTLPVVCPASGAVSVAGSGESAAVSGVGGNAFIGVAYSISRDSTTTDNTNVVQSSALASFNGDANRDFLNVQRVDSCTPGQGYTYRLTAYATTAQTNVANASFVWNGRLTATLLPAATGFAAGTKLINSASNAAPTVVTSMNVTCPASGNVVVSGSGESAALSSFAGSAFIGLAYSIAKDTTATDNGNVVQSSALAIFSGDANRDFLNVQRADSCTPGQQNTYFLTAYATTPQTNISNGSFVWNGRLVAVLAP